MSQDLETIATTYYELDDDGNTQEVCMLTGEVLRKAPSAADLILGKNVEKARVSKLSVWKYHQVYGDIICKLVSEGQTIKKISEMQGMPSRSVITRWRAESEVFKEQLALSIEDRAEQYHDVIMEDALNDHDADKDEMQQRKLKFERLKWGAAKGNPDRFGDRTKESGDSKAPLQIVVNTGIDRTKGKVDE